MPTFRHEVKDLDLDKITYIVESDKAVPDILPGWPENREITSTDVTQINIDRDKKRLLNNSLLSEYTVADLLEAILSADSGTKGPLATIRTKFAQLKTDAGL